MDEQRARRVVETLRGRNVFAHVKLPYAGITQYGIRVVLPDGREAIWDNDGTAGLEAQVMRNGILVGFVSSIPGSENFGEEQIVEASADILVALGHDPKKIRTERFGGTA